MERWLNDTTADGFLGNLRNPDKFIVTDAKWDATMDDRESGSIERPEGTTVSKTVGLLNVYEYQTSYRGIDSSSGYLNNGLSWWTLTPRSASRVWTVNYAGNANSNLVSNYSTGARPSINLKSNVKIVDGDGTIDNPYRLNGDNDTELNGTKLNTRYSGEYVRFGNEENSLYRIVSHENVVGTKITSTKPLKDFRTFKTLAFGNNVFFSSTNTIGTFLNGEYLTNYVENDYDNMIEESSTWYLGTVADGQNYRLAKYKDVNMSSLTSTTTTAKVGLLRLGELMSGQFERSTVKGGTSGTGLTTNYWTLTPGDAHFVWQIYSYGSSYSGALTIESAIKPSLNLKSNVIITSGDGTLQNPFTLELAS